MGQSFQKGNTTSWNNKNELCETTTRGCQMEMFVQTPSVGAHAVRIEAS